MKVMPGELLAPRRRGDFGPKGTKTGITYLDKRSSQIQDVLIIYPFTYINPYLNLPPIAAEYLQAGVVAAGKNVTLLDMRFEKDITEYIQKADLVCLYGYFEDCSIFGKWHIHCISEVLDQIPKDTPVVAGGTGFAHPEETLQKYQNIDVVIRGIPDTPIQELLKTGSPEEINNLVYRTEYEIVRNQSATPKLSDTIFPKRSLRNPHYQYQVLGIPVDLVRAGIGCNYRCRFCYRYGKDTDGSFLPWQGRSPASQFQELSEIEAPIILWVDDDMTTDMQALDELADLLIEHDVRKLLIGTGRLDHILKSNVSVLKKLERAGFLKLVFGVESLKEETLKFYRKGQTLEKTERSMQMMNETNILLGCNFLLGSPGETKDDMMQFLEFGRRWNVDTLVTNRLKVPEGSEVHQLIHDPETGKEKPGLERIKDEELRKIKYMIKFGQRTPFRLALTLLKMFRHRGMSLDPIYLGCRLFEGLARYTWLEKTGVLPVLFFVPKHIAKLKAFRALTRFGAIVLTPPVRLLNWLFELIDRPLGLSTTTLPALYEFYNRLLLNKQKTRAQLNRG